MANELVAISNFVPSTLGDYQQQQQTVQIKKRYYFFISGSANNTVTTLYTVPAGKRFFLLSANLASSWPSGSIATAVAQLRKSGSAQGILFNYFESNIGGAESVVLSPVEPLVFTNGEQILIDSNRAAFTAYAAIYGYEEDN